MEQQLVSRNQLAKALGITAKQVDVHRQKGTFVPVNPAAYRPTFDLDVCRTAYAEYRRQFGQKQSPTDKLKATLLKTQEDLRGTCIMLAGAERDAVSAADLKAQWTERRKQWIDRINRLPGDLAPTLVNQKDIALTAGLLEDYVRALLAELTQPITSTEDAVTESDQHEVKPAADPKELKAQLDSVRALLYTNQAKLKRIRHDVLEGLSFRRADVARVIQGYIATARAKLLGLYGSLPRLFVGLSDLELVRQKLQKEVSKVTKELKTFGTGEQFRQHGVDYLAESKEQEEQEA